MPNPITGLFRSEDEGGYSNQDMMMIGDIIKSMTYKQAVDNPQEFWKRLTSKSYRDKAAEEEERKKIEREIAQYQEEQMQPPAPAVAAPQRPMSETDPIVDPTAPSFAARLQPWGPDGQDYVDTQVDPPYPEGGYRTDEILEKFKQMNPNLDWDKVAAQAGGNVPGGNFSAMESSVTYEPTEMDKQLFDYVENQIPRDEAMRMLDSRSRAYNPEAAQMLLDRQGQKEKSASDMLYSRAQEMRAQAEAQQADMVRKQYQQLSSPEGKLGSTIEMILQNIDPAMNGPLYNLAISAKLALDNGDTRTAMELMSKLNSMTGGGIDKVSGGAQQPQVISYENL